MTNLLVLSGMCVVAGMLLAAGAVFIVMISGKPDGVLTIPRPRLRRTHAAEAVMERTGSLLVYDEIVEIKPGMLGKPSRRNRKKR
jgi:hypothetical protein